MEDKKYYTYVLLTQDDKLYCGYTDDVQKRFELHKSGKGAKYTRSHKPLKIVYTACFDTKIEAQQHEREIKKMPRKKKMEFIEIENGKLKMES